ncbi:MAG: (2Fe-2S)-binding protein [Proteobacteria bacterium]|nr:(2Fe-2S)-binding protein [Pseudomonadota bacterium]
MLVCHCFGITDRDIRAAVRRGDDATLAGSGCGGCGPLVEAVIAGERGAMITPRSLPVVQTGSHAAVFVPFGAAADSPD